VEFVQNAVRNITVISKASKVGSNRRPKRDVTSEAQSHGEHRSSDFGGTAEEARYSMCVSKTQPGKVW